MTEDPTNRMSFRCLLLAFGFQNLAASHLPSPISGKLREGTAEFAPERPAECGFRSIADAFGHRKRTVRKTSGSRSVGIILRKRRLCEESRTLDQLKKTEIVAYCIQESRQGS